MCTDVQHFMMSIRINMYMYNVFYVCFYRNVGVRGAGAPLKFHASICDLQTPGNARIITCTYVHMRACDGTPQ